MKIVVGLGNPGLRYRRTRHNLGFRVAAALGREMGVRFRRSKLRCTQAEGRMGKERVVVVRPQTFMNLSGLCVAQLVRHFDCALSDLLVVCDDVNLDLGKLRLRRSGSAGGHNGMESIIDHLHRDDFPRLRVGVGRPPDDVDRVTYVLGAFRRSEWPLIEAAVAAALQAIRTWVYYGVDEAMNRFN